MVDKEAKEVVLEYVLGKAENLKTALLVCSAYEDLKKVIITAFAQDLKRELENALGAGWKVDFSPLFSKPLEKWTGFSIGKKSWDERYGIGIEAQRPGPRDFLIGVWKKREASPIPELKAALDDKVSYGKSNDWWVWYQRVSRDYENWDSGTTLLSMWCQRESVVAYFRNEIMAIKEVSETYIDRAIPSP